MNPPPHNVGAPTREPRRPAERIGAGIGLLALLLATIPGGPDARVGSVDGGPSPADEGPRTVTLEVHDAAGARVPDATARLEGGADAPRARAEAGRLVLDAVPAGLHTIAVDAPGFARARVEVDVGSAPGAVRVTLERETLLAGRVVDESGAEVAGARILVRLDAAPDAPPHEATADAAGTFAVHGLPAERVALEARADGYEATTRSFALERGAIEHAVVVLRRAGTLVGRVIRPDGSGAARAEVVIAGSGVWPPRSIVAAEDGAFRWTGLPGGVYEVRARSGSLVSPPIEGVVVGPEREARVDLRLIQGGTLEGVVVDVATEAPIAGAVITVAEEEISLSVRATQTGADGRFTVAGLLPVRHRLTAQANGYVAAGPDPVALGGGPIRVALERAAVLEGIVVDARDRPVANARVDVLGGTGAFAGVASTGFGRALLSHQVHGPSLLESGGALGVTLGEVPPIPIEGAVGPMPMGAPGAGVGPTTDAAGRFRIDGIAAGTIQLRAQRAGFAPAVTAPMRVAAGETRREIRVVLPDGGTIEGRVVDAGGYPVGAVVVSLHAEREPLPRTLVAGEDGVFTFDGVLGDAVLTAMPIDQPAARARIHVRSGERVAVELALATDLGDVRGRVRDARDFPIAGARVSIVSLRSSAPFERSTFTDADGAFHFPGVPEPPLQVTVDHPAYAPYRSAVIRDRDAELSVELTQGGAVVGEVVDDRTGEPVEGARVTLRRGGQVLVERVTGPDGTFRAERIAPGPITVEVSSPEHLDASAQRTVAADRYGDAEVDVGTLRLAAAGRIEGRVLDAYGEPVPGAEVLLEGARGATREARSGPGGRFAIDRVPVGAYTLVATHASAGESTERQVRIEAGTDERGFELRTDRRYEASSDDLDAALVTGIAIEVRTRGGEVVVTWVAAGSSAERAGVRVGDVLVSVDEGAVSVAGEARSRLRGPEGVPAILELDRDGRAVHVRVTREPYRPPG